MRILSDRISTDFENEYCYVHARGLIMPGGFGIITTQKLWLSGCDVFTGIELMRTTDGGKTFTKPEICKNLLRQTLADGTDEVMCDATPFYHKKTGKIIITGHTARYGADNKLLGAPRPRNAVYSVFDSDSMEFSIPRCIELQEEFFSAGAGCTQIHELSDGELLIPIYYKDYETECNPHGCYSALVLRCSFDGENINVLKIGKPLSIDVPRGLYEPSVTEYRGEYFLALRNDESGYVARSLDGLEFDTPRKLCFDNGETLGNYNTQQHWLNGDGKLWLVYTRRAENNNHVFRHRAPLFIAEFDTERMCVIKDTERIAVAERGARLGNFGCQSYSDEIGYVYAAEWMQGPKGAQGCAEHGSDNSIFISKIYYQ